MFLIPGLLAVQPFLCGFVLSSGRREGLVPRWRLDRRTAIRHSPGRERIPTLERRPDHFLRRTDQHNSRLRRLERMGCIMFGYFWVGCVICYMFFKSFFVMKSNPQGCALHFQHVKTHVASECLGRFVVVFFFSYLACSPRTSKSTHLYSTMLGVFRA